MMQHMIISFPFTFKRHALHKYASASSHSKSSKFLILQFLVKCWKQHSVFQILSKSHMLDIFFFQVFTTNFHINHDFILSKRLNIKLKNSICACSVVPSAFIYASNEQLFVTLITNLGKKSICACQSKQIKTSFVRIK